MPSVLFVCLGNICRSPAAEGVMRHLAQKDPSIDVHIESCGMGDWHVGQLPDARMRNAIHARGIVLSSRAQRFDPVFIDAYDYILAVDHDILADLHHHAHTPEQKAKIHLLTDFSKLYKGQDIPDPYYGGPGAFELVIDMIEESCQGLLEQIKKKS
jgi:protein-tyrosine phosphatase